MIKIVVIMFPNVNPNSAQLNKKNATTVDSFTVVSKKSQIEQLITEINNISHLHAFGDMSLIMRLMESLTIRLVNAKH